MEETVAVAGDRQQRYLDALALLSLFCEQWPNAFKREGIAPPPLQVGIHRDIHEQIGDLVTPEVFHLALHLYTKRAAYYAVLRAPGAMRVNLQGDPVDMVTAAELAFLDNLGKKTPRKP